MAERRVNSQGQQLKADVERLKESLDSKHLKKKFDISHFDANAILRGIQLTLVGAHRALQNPGLFTSDHYKQAAYAVIIGIIIRILISIPIVFIKFLIWVISFFWSLESAAWDEAVIDGLNFTSEYVLQIPLFLMTLMRYVVPTLDDLFMQSLRWVDLTYVQKHKHDQPKELRGMFYPNLQMYETSWREPSTPNRAPLYQFLYRFAKKGAISAIVFGLSFLPLIGKLVLPAASFYTFKSTAGLGPASLIFGGSIFVPRRYLIIFLQTYFSSRSLMRELLNPYFSRVPFTAKEKKNWFRSREGVLFGFGLGFFVLVRVPLVGVLIYGIAEASTAYLITKITDPPLPPSMSREYAASQQTWSNKHEFLSLPLRNIDTLQYHAAQETPKLEKNA